MDARRLEVEWLDELPPADPRARRSRADLRRINALMGNARILASALLAEKKRCQVDFSPREKQRCQVDFSPRENSTWHRFSVCELGAGDGAFALRVVQSLGFAAIDVSLVDRQRIVSQEMLDAFAVARASVAVAQDDVFDWLERAGPAIDVVMANLFLHHFEDGPLRRMFSLVARRARMFVACETRRSAFAMAGARMLGAIGCNDVTRHDAVASIRAGFRDGELSALWPAGPWHLREEARGLFSHLFVATKTVPGSLFDVVDGLEK